MYDASLMPFYHINNVEIAILLCPGKTQHYAFYINLAAISIVTATCYL